MGKDVLEDLLNSLDKFKDQVNFQELVRSVFSLSKILPENTSLQSLGEYSLEILTKTDEIELIDLSRLTVILDHFRLLPVFYTYPIIVPRIETFLHKQDLSADDLLALTVVMKPLIR